MSTLSTVHNILSHVLYFGEQTHIAWLQNRYPFTLQGRERYTLLNILPKSVGTNPLAAIDCAFNSQRHDMKFCFIMKAKSAAFE